MTQPSPGQRLREIQALLQENRRQEAYMLLKQLVEDQPKSAKAWWLLAASTTQPEEMYQALKRVVALKPDHEGAQRKLAKLEARLGKSKPAAPASQSSSRTESQQKARKPSSGRLSLMIGGGVAIVILIGAGIFLVSQLLGDGEGIGTSLAIGGGPAHFTQNIGTCDESVPDEECQEIESAVTTPIEPEYRIDFLLSMETGMGNMASNTTNIAVDGPVEFNEHGEIVRADFRARTINEMSTMFGGDGPSMLNDEAYFYIRPDRIYVGIVRNASGGEEIQWTHVDRNSSEMRDINLTFNTVFPTEYFQELPFDKAWIRLEDMEDFDGTPLTVFRFNFVDPEPMVSGFNALGPFSVERNESDSTDPASAVMSEFASAALAASFPIAVAEYVGFIGIDANTGRLDQFITRQTLIVDTSRPPNPTLSGEPTIYDFDMSFMEDMLGTEAEITYRIAVNFSPRTESDTFAETLPEDSQPMAESAAEYIGHLGQNGAVQMVAGYMLPLSSGFFMPF